MAVTIAIESPLQDEVRALIAALNAYLLPLSPPEFQFMLSVEDMAGPDIAVFIARDAAGRAVGCGALKVHEGGVGEVKRMFTLPELRGQRVGEQVLAAIEAGARERYVSRLLIETGTGAAMAPAQRLYERAGFSPCGAFLDYPENPYSAFYEKALI